MTAAALTLLAVLGLAHAQEAAGTSVSPLKGKLYRSVFFDGPGGLTPADLAPLPEPARERLTRFLARRAAYRTRYTHEAASFDQLRADAKRRDIERAIVALVDVAGVEDRAVEFVKAVPIEVDWKGRAAGPLAEATAAEEFLKLAPSSPVAPYVYVFIAHRQRAAFEAHATAQDADGMRAASKKYRTFLQRARSVEDPVFALIADDMDRQPHVFLRTDQHPATFDPDA